MDRIKIKRDLKNSVGIMESNIVLFNQGRNEVYLVIANELRKLICDRSIGKKNAKDNSLLPKIFSKIILSPIKDSDIETESNMVFRSYGGMKFNGKGGYKIIDLFDETKPKILRDDWLKQPIMFVNGKVTLEDFIKSIADKEGVHSDDHYNTTIQRVKILNLGDSDTRAHYIVAIGEYLLKEIKVHAKLLLTG